ncbi:unnamed protein product [Blepharisma stoltei]|uniref:Uncharacterized protein n=1 Tax=Blepharisma stoltei TaxID=1481888 RepID=A0AAU9JY68_9CILI|nr:unnamed protein product [Blepharisma stoltei]
MDNTKFHKMGIIKSKSKIPSPIHGNILLFTGIKELDDIYKELEKPVSKVNKFKANFDGIITNLIRELGAEIHWEINLDLQEIFRMVLVVLSANCAGKLNEINLNFTSENPYILFDTPKLNRKSRKLMAIYYELMNFLIETPRKLEDIKKTIKKWVKREEDFPKKIAELTEDLDFSSQDKITAVLNMDKNHEIISKSPELLDEFFDAIELVKYSINEIIKEFQKPLYSERLVSRGIQAHAKRIKSPKELVRLFWPLINEETDD